MRYGIHVFLGLGLFVAGCDEYATTAQVDKIEDQEDLSGRAVYQGKCSELVDLGTGSFALLYEVTEFDNGDASSHVIIIGANFSSSNTSYYPANHEDNSTTPINIGADAVGDDNGGYWRTGGPRNPLDVDAVYTDNDLSSDVIVLFDASDDCDEYVY